MMDKTKLVKSAMPFVALAIIYVIFKTLQPERFGTPNSMYVLLQQTLIHAILACGFYYILVMNIYDLTLGVNTILSSMAGVLLSRALGVPGLVLGALACGILIAYISSFLMIHIKAPPIIISVSLVILYEAVSVLLSKGSSTLTLASEYRFVGSAPYDMLPGLAVLVGTAMLMKYTRFGVYVTAIGANPQISEAMGIDVKKYKTLAFVACGVCMGVYAFTSLCYSQSVASATSLSSVTSIFKPFMACMFAMAFQKYLNPMVSLVIGCFILNMLSNGLMTNGLEAALQNVVVGFAMILLVRFSSASRKFDVVK